MLWVDKPQLLLHPQFWPGPQYTQEENINRFTRLIIILTLLFTLLLKKAKIIYIGMVIIVVTAILYYIYAIPKEAFMDPYPGNRPQTEPKLRYPTPQNPFMNVPISSYDEPQVFRGYPRYAAVTYPTPETESIRQNIDQKFIQGLFQDANGRLWERNNSQREYISQPVSGVPNAQSEFAQWLYGREFVCKSGSIWDRYGLPYTQDSLVCNGFNAAVPTNLEKPFNKY